MSFRTILSEQPVNTGSTGPQSTPDDLGGLGAAGLARLAQGLDHSGAEMSSMATVLKDRQQQKDLAWVSGQLAQEKMTTNTWMSNPENHTKETFADDTRAFMNDRLTQASQLAPNERAANLFKRHFEAFMADRHESALLTGEKNRLNDTVLGFQKQTDSAIAGYRAARDIPNVDAGQDLINSLNLTRNAIQKSLGMTMPGTAEHLQDRALINAAYATMNDSPALARKITMMSDTMDEHTRHTILDHIDSAERSLHVADQIQFEKVRADAIASVKLDKSQDKIGLDKYQLIYPRDKALALKARDDAQIDTYNQVNSIIDRISPLAPSEQQREVSKFAANAKTDQDLDVLQDLTQKVKQSALLEERNRVSWLQQNNPAVKQALDSAIASTDNDRMGALTRLYDVTMRYQGAPPPDANEDERRQYLNRPTNDLHLMTQEEAEQNAAMINKGTPQEMLKNIQQVLSKYPGEKYQNVAFNDMVNLPKGGNSIKQEYQLAYLNSSAHWVDEYLGAIKGSDSIKNMTGDKIRDFEQSLDTDPLWRAFSHSMLGDNYQRADEVAGFRNGILAYAHARATTKNEGAPASIKAATKMLIGSELGFANVNGQTLMIPRDAGQGKPYRTDQDIETLGERLRLSLQLVDPRQVKWSDEQGRSLFPAIEKAGTDKVKIQQLRDLITSKGFFQNSADGKSLSLYLTDNGKLPFQVRDSHNQAFTINLDDLAQTKLFNEYHTFSGMPIASTPGIVSPNSIESRGFWPWWPFHTEKKEIRYPIGDLNDTNWPVHSDLIKHGSKVGLDPNFKFQPSSGINTPPDDR